MHNPRVTRIRRHFLVLVACMFGALLGASRTGHAASAAEPLSECSNEERFGKRYYLTADLDCGGARGINLARSATLDLNGFSIRNAGIAVHCSRRCTILGPGIISDSHGGIDGYKVTLVDVTLRDIEEDAVRALKRLKLEVSLIETSGTGVLAPIRTLLVDSQITGNRRDGIRGFGIRRFRGRDEERCVGRKVQLINSTVAGNNTGPFAGNDCELGDYSACADIRTCDRAPRLDATSSCGTSLSVESGTSWAVCTLD